MYSLVITLELKANKSLNTINDSERIRLIGST